jgi:prepilin-type N-terminal cleavage/methylation domain-containing protein
MKSRGGFTLIELLVVIAVVGVLMGVVVAVLNPAAYFKRGRDSRRLSDLTVVQSALEQYFAQNGSYPTTGGVPFGAGWLPYLKFVPNDPQNAEDTTKVYEYCASGTPPSNYEVCATMESTPLPDDCVDSVSICTPATAKCCLTNPF